MALDPGQPPKDKFSNKTDGTLYFKNIYFDSKRRTIPDPMQYIPIAYESYTNNTDLFSKPALIAGHQALGWVDKRMATLKFIKICSFSEVYDPELNICLPCEEKYFTNYKYRERCRECPENPVNGSFGFMCDRYREFKPFDSAINFLYNRPPPVIVVNKLLEAIKKIGIYGGSLLALVGSFYMGRKLKKCIADFMFDRELKQMER